MDILTLGLIAAGAISGLVFVLRRQQSARRKEDVSLPDYKTQQQAGSRQQTLDLDPKTRFVETPKRRQYRLLNEAEQELYGRLQEAMPNMRIFAQIGISQLAQLRGRSEAQRLLHMSTRGVDFVVCDEDFGILAAIELVWPTSDSDTQPEDEKRAALESLGIPLIVFRPNLLPDADAISREIANAIVRRNRLERERG